MAEQRLYSVAAIAKILDMPESTLHYWKNRFDDVLPSVGRGRNKRFRPESVDIFRAIGRLLGQGLSAVDVRAELARQYPVNVVPQPASEGLGPAPRSADADEFDIGATVAVAAGIGAEIAKGLLAHLQQNFQPQALALPDETVLGLTSELAAVRSENAALTEKMRLLETELVRLRKDRRELETYLVDKINALRKEPTP